MNDRTDTNVGGPYKNVLIDIVWVVPLPSNSHQGRIILFLVGDQYKPSFATVTGRGDNPRYCL